MKKIHLDITFIVSDESMKSALRLAYPILSKGLQLQHEAKLIDAIEDIELSDGDSINNLIPYCLKLVENKSTEYNSKQAIMLERIQSYIIDLFNDWCRFKNVNRKVKLAKLKEKIFMKSCTLEDLYNLFDTESNIEQN
ncbi:hypothetical protein O3M35_003856 [Rhynocoris fuscipes]|uniref:BBS7 helical hairpin domain-containing protein n=1 Tax=Rhynocoris fuscipes TaxID=488301 RepID=A0AAW1CJV3_9HEMI